MKLDACDSLPPGKDDMIWNAICRIDEIQLLGR